MPEFPGGDLALRKYIANAVKYPVIAQENGIQGKVYVTFVVGKDGNISNASIARGVDASLDKHSKHFLSEKKIDEPSEKWEAYVWSDINYSFSTPVSVREEHNHYVPTQYLSEYFKNAGYDGIIYKSSLTEEGHNIVLFDPKVMSLMAAELHDIKSITYEYGQGANGYVCKKEKIGDCEGNER